MHAKGVIVTRPEPGLTETLLAVQKAGWDAYPSPSLCITLRELLPLPPRTICAVLLTSGQAIPALCGKIPQEMPFYVVGDRTAERVRQAGFVNVQSANGNAEDLIKCVCQHYTPLSGTLLIATGRGCGITLADTLRQIGFRVIRRVVYETRATAEIDSSVITLLEQRLVAAIMFFSARSTISWFGALSQSQQKIARTVRSVVISETVARTVESLKWKAPISVASHPHAIGMINALGRYS
ncbi:MAG: uroporphyrinogen-III synthase [Acetobacter sp.]|nr:uroporphyrinogen-III synthase [Acetobacter sp.]